VRARVTWPCGPCAASSVPETAIGAQSDGKCESTAGTLSLPDEGKQTGHATPAVDEPSLIQIHSMGPSRSLLQAFRPTSTSPLPYSDPSTTLASYSFRRLVKPQTGGAGRGSSCACEEPSERGSRRIHLRHTRTSLPFPSLPFARLRSRPVPSLRRAMAAAAARAPPRAAARVGLLYDERMCAHATPDGEDHPENPERLRTIWRKLNAEGVASRYRLSSLAAARRFPPSTTRWDLEAPVRGFGVESLRWGNTQRLRARSLSLLSFLLLM
jgi:hypothetical protein